VTEDIKMFELASVVRMGSLENEGFELERSIEAGIESLYELG
jgi:hypothetical protein